MRVGDGAFEGPTPQSLNPSWVHGCESQKPTLEIIPGISSVSPCSEAQTQESTKLGAQCRRGKEWVLFRVVASVKECFKAEIGCLGAKKDDHDMDSIAWCPSSGNPTKPPATYFPRSPP